MAEKERKKKKGHVKKGGEFLFEKWIHVVDAELPARTVGSFRNIRLIKVGGDTVGG